MGSIMPTSFSCQPMNQPASFTDLVLDIYSPMVARSVAFEVFLFTSGFNEMETVRHFPRHLVRGHMQSSSLCHIPLPAEIRSPRQQAVSPPPNTVAQENEKPSKQEPPEAASTHPERFRFQDDIDIGTRSPAPSTAGPSLHRNISRGSLSIHSGGSNAGEHRSLVATGTRNVVGQIAKLTNEPQKGSYHS